MKSFKHYLLHFSILGLFFLSTLNTCAQTTPSFKLSNPTRALEVGVKVEANNAHLLAEPVTEGTVDYKDSIAKHIITEMRTGISNQHRDEHRKVKSYRSTLILRDHIFQDEMQLELYRQKVAINNTVRDTVLFQKHRETMIHLSKMRDDYATRTSNDWKYFYKYRHYFRNNKAMVFMPVLDNFGSQIYFSNAIDTQKFLSNSGITMNGKLSNTGVYSEIYHDYLGPFRLGISAAFSSENNSSDSIESDSLNTQNGMLTRLLTSGGNAVVNATIPLFKAQSRLGFYSFRSHLNNKVGFDVQANDEMVKNPNFMYEGSIDGILNLIGIEKKISVFMYGKAALIYGNQTFNSLIGFEKKQLVSINQLSLGIELANFIRINYSVYGGTKLIKENFNTGLNITYINSF